MKANFNVDECELVFVEAAGDAAYQWNGSQS